MKRVFFLIPMLTLALGCGDEAPEGSIVEGIVPVSGTATYQGKPLQDYAIYFSDGKNRPATGMVDAQGHFTLSTNAEGDGAPVGSHKVWLVYSPVVEENPEVLDPKIPPPKVKLPAKYTSLEKTDLTVEVPEAGLTDHKLEVK
jgi:hypothetical protein